MAYWMAKFKRQLLEQIHRVRSIVSWYWQYAATTTSYFPTFLKASMMPANYCCLSTY